VSLFTLFPGRFDFHHSCRCVSGSCCRYYHHLFGHYVVTFTFGWPHRCWRCLILVDTFCCWHYPDDSFRRTPGIFGPGPFTDDRSFGIVTRYINFTTIPCVTVGILFWLRYLFIWPLLHSVFGICWPIRYLMLLFVVLTSPQLFIPLSPFYCCLVAIHHSVIDIWCAGYDIPLIPFGRENHFHWRLAVRWYSFHSMTDHIPSIHGIVVRYSGWMRYSPDAPPTPR